VTARVHAAGAAGVAVDPARHAAYVTSGGRELLGDLYVVQPCR
jgi:hypothetical protein